MRKLLFFPLLTFALMAVDQTVNMSVSEIEEMSISSNVQINVPTPIAGSHPEVVFDSSSEYGITSNTNHQLKITASIDEELFDNYQALSIRLDAPLGATSAGKKLLALSDRELVTGIPDKTEENALIIHYEFDPSNVSEGVFSRTVTFSLIDDL